MKKIISAILSMCMAAAAVSAIPVRVSAAAAASEMYYSGEKLDSSTPYLLIGKAEGAQSTTVKASASDNGSGGTWSVLAQFDAQAGRLTFKSGRDITTNPWDVGMPLKQIDTNGDGDISNEKYYGIYADGSLTIDLEGYVNLLYLDRQSPKDAAQEGIHVEGDLTINGTQKGMLRVTANPSGKKDGGLQSYGIYSGGTVTLNGGTLDAYETTYNLGYFYLEHNYTTFIKAENVNLNGGSLLLRGRNNSSSKPDNKKLYDIGSGRLSVPDYYEQKWAKEFEYAPETSAKDQDRLKGNDGNTDFHSQEQSDDRYVRFERMSGYEITVLNNANTPVTLSGEMRYLAKSGDGYIASSSANDAYAEYIASEKTLNILKDTELTVVANNMRVDGASPCINSESDLIINIPEDVTLSLNGQNNGRNKNIRAKGDITIRGEGSLKAFACKDYLGTGENSAAIWSDNGDVTIEGKINANLYTRELSQGQIAHVIYAGGNNINIGEYATVTMGTDIGKLFNDGTVLDIYQNAEAKMAASAETKTTGVEPKSELMDYNASNVSEMKYLSIAAMPMKLEKISGFDSRNMLPLSKPEIELTFNLEIAEAPSVQDLSIDNGAKISGISASGRSLKISLSDVKADGEYTLKLKNIKNAAGLEYTEDYSFKVSGGSDVLSIKLNGSESGEVKTNNSVSVTLSKAASVAEMNAVVTVVVWDKATVGGKTVKRLKSAASQNLKNITGTKTADLSGIAAETDDIIEVFVWNSGTGLKVLSKAAEFAN